MYTYIMRQVKKFSRKSLQIRLLCIDVILLLFSVVLSLIIRNGSIGHGSHLRSVIISFLPVIAFYLIFMYTIELYNIDKYYSLTHLIQAFSYSSFASLLFASFIFYFSPQRNTLPKRILIFFCIISIITLVISRKIFYKVNLQQKLPIVFIGYNSTVKSLLKHTQSTYISYEPVAIFTQSPIQYDNIHILSTVDELKKYIYAHQHINTFVIDKTTHSDELTSYILSGHHWGITTIPLDTFYEHLLRRVPIKNIDIHSIISTANIKNKKVYIKVKRMFDIMVSLIGLIVSLPILLLAACLIKIYDRGPVFFKQKRKGYAGSIFTIYKLRTMSIEDNGNSFLKQNEQRITKPGKILRKIRVDELPQLFNVLKGDMSLIGPRPDYVDFADYLETSLPIYQYRYVVKPGITGWDQICGTYHSSTIKDTSMKLEYDFYYIKNMSFFLDVSICFKTIMTIFRMQGK